MHRDNEQDGQSSCPAPDTAVAGYVALPIAFKVP